MLKNASYAQHQEDSSRNFTLLDKQIKSQKLDEIFCVYIMGNLKGCSVIRVLTIPASIHKKYYEDKLCRAERFKYPLWQQNQKVQQYSKLEQIPPQNLHLSYNWIASFGAAQLLITKGDQFKEHTGTCRSDDFVSFYKQGVNSSLTEYGQQYKSTIYVPWHQPDFSQLEQLLNNYSLHIILFFLISITIFCEILPKNIYYRTLCSIKGEYGIPWLVFSLE